MKDNIHRREVVVEVISMRMDEENDFVKATL